MCGNCIFWFSRSHAKDALLTEIFSLLKKRTSESETGPYKNSSVEYYAALRNKLLCCENRRHEQGFHFWSYFAKKRSKIEPPITLKDATSKSCFSFKALLIFRITKPFLTPTVVSERVTFNKQFSPIWSKELQRMKLSPTKNQPLSVIQKINSFSRDVNVIWRFDFRDTFFRQVV